MSSYVVWLDQEHAKAFKFLPGKVEQSSVKRATHDHHTHAHKEDNNGEEAFFHQVAEHIKDATELLIVGPGLAKTHFKTHLEKHHHHDLLKKIVGIETMSHPTDPEIVASARKSFRTAHLFT